MEILNDLWRFMMARKKFWLVPVVLVIVLVGGLLVFGGGTAFAPFIYSLF